MENLRNHSKGFSRQLKTLPVCMIIILMMLPAILTHGQHANALNANSRRLNKATTPEREVGKIYRSQIGVREKQVNSGPEVEKYLRYVHLPKGNPWCAAFVCWVYGQAKVPNPRSGWSPDLFPASRIVWQSGAAGKTPGAISHNQTSPSPRTADVFGIYFPDKGRIAHVGFIDEWKEPWLITVEGNTNLAGHNDGDGVYRKRRLVRSIYQVVRYID
jgi:hypothetical protein